MACVYGPASTVTRKENAEQAVVEVQYRLAAGLPGELQDWKVFSSNQSQSWQIRNDLPVGSSHQDPCNSPGEF